MAVKTHKLGPGSLSLGAVADVREFGVALSSATLTPSASEGDTIAVLSGDEFIDDGEETWTLDGTLYQSYDEDSLIKWCFDNSGTTMPFTFVPSDEAALVATGSVLVRSIAMGGEVKTRNTSDFSFRVIDLELGTAGA